MTVLQDPYYNPAPLIPSIIIEGGTSPVILVYGTNTFTYPNIKGYPVNTSLFLSANVSVPTNLSVVEYKWDMGDGTLNYGPSISHIYQIPSPDVSITLNVTDNIGRTFSVGQSVVLTPRSPLLVPSDHIYAS